MRFAAFFALRAAPAVLGLFLSACPSWGQERAVAYGPFSVGEARLRVELPVRREEGRDLTRSARVVEEAGGTLLHEERYDVGAMVKPFVWTVAGIDALALDAEAFPTPRGGERRLALLVWDAAYCPVGRKRSAPAAPTGRLMPAARLFIPDGSLVERPADAPPEPLRGERVTATAWDPAGRLYLKVGLRLRLCAPAGERVAFAPEGEPRGPWPVECAPYAMDPAARGPSVLLYDAPTGAEGGIAVLTASSEILLGKAYLDAGPVTASGNDYALAARYARVEAFIDGRRGFVAAEDAGRLGLLSPP